MLPCRISPNTMSNNAISPKYPWESEKKIEEFRELPKKSAGIMVDGDGIWSIDR